VGDATALTAGGRVFQASAATGNPRSPSVGRRATDVESALLCGAKTLSFVD